MTIVKNVRVHTCYSIEMNEPRPVLCDCKKFVSLYEAEQMIRKGLAQYVVGFDRPKAYEDGSQICMVGRQKQTPRGATIERAHIEKAYIYKDLDECYRIEMYGLLTLMSRIMIGKNKVFIPLADEPEGGREHDYGRSILYFPRDGRI